MYAIVEIHDVSPFYKQEVYQAVEFLQGLKIDKFSLFWSFQTTWKNTLFINIRIL